MFKEGFSGKLDTYLGKHIDGKTGFGNRTLLYREFNAITKKEGYVLVMLLLNEFHNINSLFGFELNDKTIEKLCPYMRSFAEKHSGKVYRPHMNRFVLLVKHGDKEAFNEELRQMVAGMEKVCVADERAAYYYHYTFTYTVYFMESADDGIKDLEELMAPMMMIQPESPNSTYGVEYASEIRPDWERLKTLEGDLKRAWGNHEFVPYYQMVYELQTRRPVGAELLTRWNHPVFGILCPAEFLPLLEESGLIVDLDLYILEEACKRIKKWIDEELVTVPLSINISHLNLYRQGFVEQVIQTVERYEVPPVLIELEIAGDFILREQNACSMEVWKRLHDYGFTLSLDDADSGAESSVNLLKMFPVDVLKIKPGFFEAAKESQRNQIFVNNIVRMMEEMKIRIIAAKIASEEQLEEYKERGCLFGQGFYLSEPETEEEFEKEVF